MGFTGKALYDEIQISHIHAAFTPDQKAIDHAYKVLEAVIKSPTRQARVAGVSVNRANVKTAQKIIYNAKRRGVI